MRYGEKNSYFFSFSFSILSHVSLEFDILTQFMACLILGKIVRQSEVSRNLSIPTELEKKICKYCYIHVSV